METQFINVQNGDSSLKIAYDIDARGDRAMICLHGLQSNRHMFAPLIDLCSRKDLTMIAIDFVGFGDSDKPQAFSYALEEQARIIHDAFSNIGLKKFFIIGHSMGGMVGTMLLETWKHSLLGFINMEGNFVLNDCGASLSATRTTLKEFSNTGFPHFLKELRSSGEPSAHLRSDWLQSTPDYAFYKSSLSIVDWSRNQKLIPLFVDATVPKLFVYGDQNRRKRDVLPPTVPTKEISGAGHFMLADAPEETLKTIEEFLDS